METTTSFPHDNTEYIPNTILTLLLWSHTILSVSSDFETRKWIDILQLKKDKKNLKDFDDEI